MLPIQLSDVVTAYRTAQGFSLRQFADSLNERLVNTDISYATVSRWENCEARCEPEMQFLFECIATYIDWRAEFAADCLKAMWPDLFSSGVIVIRLPVAG